MIAKYCRCEECNTYFGMTKARRYCTRQCRDAAYYKRKPKPHKLRSSYNNMIRRCTDPKSADYPTYGARGITVCDRWLSKGGFERFLEDVEPRPPKTSIDRIDNSQGYSPDNCRWATPRQQSLNTRKNNEHSNIYFAKHRNAYCVQYMIDGKRVSKGNFKTLEEAQAVKKAMNV